MSAKYPILPVMQCEPNCGRCCGFAPCTQGEFEAIDSFAKANGITPVNQGVTCPWYQNGGCSVYQVRPAICRLFGHQDDERLTCCHGYNINVSGVAIRQLKKKINGASRLTHEAIQGWTMESNGTADIKNYLKSNQP